MHLETGNKWGWRMGKLHWIDRKTLKPFFDRYMSRAKLCGVKLSNYNEYNKTRQYAEHGIEY